MQSSGGNAYSSFRRPRLTRDSQDASSSNGIEIVNSVMWLAIREMIDSEGSLMLTKTGVQATIILVALGLSTGCGPSPVVPPHDTANTTTAAQDFGEVVAAVDKQLLESQIREACTYCHAYPEPQTIPKEFWEKELRQAYGFLEHSDFDPQKVPPFAPTLRFFRDRAPCLLYTSPSPRD